MSDGDRGHRATRRGFLKAAGLSAASLAACQRLPVERSLPYLVPPEEIVPGVPTWYASTCNACGAGCGVLSKVLDGRPVKLEGNADHPLSRGGLCAVGQGQIRELYDPGRLRAPLVAGRPVSWRQLDETVAAGLARARTGNGSIYVVSRTIVSPSARAAVAGFVDATGARLVEHDLDPQAPAALREAHAVLLGRPLSPGLDFEQADVLVSLAADPLATGPEPVTHAAEWASRRRDPERGAPYHLQIEGSLSGTGAMADERWHATAVERQAIALELLRGVAERVGSTEAVAILEALGAESDSPSVPHAADLPRVASELVAHAGRSLVLSAGDDLTEQLAVALANRLLGNEGTTIRFEGESLVSRSSDRDLFSFRDDLLSGRVSAAIFVDADPVGMLPGGDRLARALAEVPTTVGIFRRPTATSRACRAVVAAHHALECWTDVESRRGVVTLAQPSVRPLFDTRHPWESFLRWSGAATGDWLTWIRSRWQRAGVEALAPRPASSDPSTAPTPPPGPFDAAWNEIVRTAGLADPEAAAAAAFSLSPSPEAAPGSDSIEAVATLRRRLSESTSARSDPADPSELELELVAEVSGRAGAHAANPWLRELPDPLTRVSWTPCVRIAPERASLIGVEDGDEVGIEVGDAFVALPVRVLTGQHPDVVAVPLGYGDGSEAADCDARGDLAAALLMVADGAIRHRGIPARVRPTGARTRLPLMQVEEDPHGRPVIHQLPSRGDTVHEVHHPDASLWPEREHTSPHWEMTIDLDACIGCGSCVVACQAENNIPVVGADLIRQHRDMHWLRIDRYVTGDSEQPDVVFEPMLCAQCDNAPCETVCPVAATLHSADGLNQQVYNRCVGTRYCANNCPYKVRRFNWYDFQPEDPVERLALNPDVVVRSRGVMEKCTFCVQRIQSARIHGRREEVSVEVQTACQQSCPTQAIRFADATDPSSSVSRQKRQGRAFQVLAELGVKPSVTYLARVRNRPGFGDEHEAASGDQPPAPDGSAPSEDADPHDGGRR